MSIHYQKITLTDGTRLILRVTKESPRFVHGYEVNAEGDEIVPPGYENRHRSVERTSIAKTVEMRMNNTYATLEAVPRAAKRVTAKANPMTKTPAELDRDIAEALARKPRAGGASPTLSSAESASIQKIYTRSDRANGDLRRAQKLGDAKKIASAQRAIARAQDAMAAIENPKISHLWAPRRIRYTSASPWRGPTGQGMHRYEIEMVLDHKNISGPQYRKVRVISESGAPPTGSREAPEVMGTAWHALQDSIDRGDIVVIEE